MPPKDEVSSALATSTGLGHGVGEPPGRTARLESARKAAQPLYNKAACHFDNAVEVMGRYPRYTSGELGIFGLPRECMD